jgi:hypothetical protein
MIFFIFLSLLAFREKMRDNEMALTTKKKYYVKGTLNNHQTGQINVEAQEEHDETSNQKKAGSIFIKEKKFML